MKWRMRYIDDVIKCHALACTWSIWAYRWSHCGIGLYVILKSSHNVKIITKDEHAFVKVLKKSKHTLLPFHKLGLDREMAVINNNVEPDYR